MAFSILNDTEEGKTHAHLLFTIKVERRKALSVSSMKLELNVHRRIIEMIGIKSLAKAKESS